MDEFDAQEPVTTTEEQPVEAPEVGTEAPVESDRFARLRSELGDDFDPELVVKNYKQYTQTHQELAEERKRLEPLRQVEQAFTDDPEFARYVLEYQKRKDDELSAEELANRALAEAQAVRADIATEKALAGLHKSVAEKGRPDFDDAELLSFAVKIGTRDLEAAYLKMKQDELLSSVERKVIEENKAKKQAGVETRVKEGGSPAPRTKEDWASLDDEAFLKAMKKVNG